MSQLVASAVREYLARLNRRSDPAIDDVRRQSEESRLPALDPEAAALVGLLVAAIGARHVLEIGTALGYSGLTIARALPPDGRLITFEVDADRAARARANFQAAGVGERVSIMTGNASRLVSKVAGPFDLILQDADKLQYDVLLDRLVALLRPDGLLITDNILWSGAVVPGFDAPDRPADATAAIAAYNERLANDTRLETVFVAVGDGLAISRKRA